MDRGAEGNKSALLRLVSERTDHLFELQGATTGNKKVIAIHTLVEQPNV